MTFTVQYMLGDQALVSGTDLAGNTGKTMVSTTQWEELKSRKNFSSAVEDFDAKVEEFFAPLVKAAEAAQQATAPKAPDALSYVVLKEGVEGVPAEQSEIVELTHDSIVLRLIEEGKTDRLTWVDESTLGITAA